MPKAAKNVGESPGSRVKATRREFLGGATVLAAYITPACDSPIADPIIAMIAEEKRWRLLAVAARMRAEKVLFALPRDEWPEEFDDHPIMAEALSHEIRADEVYTHIVASPAITLAGIFAKLEWGETDAEITAAVIADLRRWLSAIMSAANIRRFHNREFP